MEQFKARTGSVGQEIDALASAGQESCRDSPGCDLGYCIPVVPGKYGRQVGYGKEVVLWGSNGPECALKATDRLHTIRLAHDRDVVNIK